MNNFLLDFYSGSHGHFLEYLINTYIFRKPKVKNIFTELGTSHGIREDQTYMKNRVIKDGHYTEFNYPADTPDKLIRITINTAMEKVVYQINVDSRAGEIPQDKKMELMADKFKKNTAMLRNNYYSKLTDVEHGYPLPTNWRWTDVPGFEIPMGSLYNLNELYSSLKQSAEFLSHSFNPDPSLVELWQKFINLNQGVQIWKKCSNLVENALAAQECAFSSSVQEQALINYLLTQTIGICSGPLFDSNDYPQNTLELFQEIHSYITQFDNRF